MISLINSHGDRKSNFDTELPLKGHYKISYELDFNGFDQYDFRHSNSLKIRTANRIEIVLIRTDT